MHKNPMPFMWTGKTCRRVMWIAGCCLLLFVFLELLRQPNLLKKRYRPFQISQDLIVGNINEEEESNSKCILPILKEMREQQSKRPFTLNCTADANWITSTMGLFHIKEATKKTYPDVKCAMVPVLQQDDYEVYYGDAIDGISSDRNLSSDFFVANCFSEQRSKRYQMLHAGISAKPPRVKREESTKAKQLSIVMIGLDSVSKLAWKHYLPQTYGFFINDLEGVVFDKFNILGDGTTQNLLPMLTGKQEHELYESRRGFNNSKTIDNYPWIWRQLSQMNYATQFGEDGSKFGTFQYRLRGFKQQPTDHYMRPFYLKLDELYPHRHYGCLGSKPLHQVKLDWQIDFLNAYRHRKRFSLIFHSELSHEDNHQLTAMDADLVKHLRRVKSAGHLDNAVLILFSDHGHRYASSRATLQGKYEERLPFLGLALPKHVIDEYPIESKQLLRNKNKLVTALDVHATMLHLLQLFQTNSDSSSSSTTSTTSISLLNPISEKRNCKQAGIDSHWCSCLAWQSVSVLGTSIKSIAHYAVQRINELTAKQRGRCAELMLSKLLSADSFTPSQKLLKFKQSADIHGRVPEFSDTMSASHRLYQITIETQPNNGRYEVTISEEISSGSLSLNTDAISRINAYGNHASCVQEQLPHLRPFCYCLH